ncbi:MAG: diguanylate cyclase [Methyloversatilis discipulorum]|uniref:GGDEF domain-containing protein n=1 Tax=Methyloversatilis discipulorum TaxID=1119528 RepID=UPI0026F2A566|nr:GGDEF domain-containing protein [Methyloversatilis discipulorum]MBT9515852.1 diguanylate cyclase [Methyloversatilis discipulorum]
MRLHRLFWLVSLLLACAVLGLSLRIVVVEWSRAAQARSGLEAMEHLRHLLLAAEMASRERGPANGVLGDDLPGDPAKRERLAQARARTDAAFAVLERTVGTPAAPRNEVRALIARAALQLAHAREAIDRTAALPRARRSPADISEAIGKMFAVIDDLSPALMRLTNEAVAAYPRAADALIGARIAADLREYAGQLGSQFTVALTSRQPLRDAEHVEIERLRGRVEQLRKLLVQRTEAAPDRVPVQTATATMQLRYFESAIPFVEALTAHGLDDAQYGMDAAGFAARYVPDMDSIVTLRDVLMDEALDQARSGHAEARTALIWIGAGGLLTLGLLGLTLWVVHHRVVRPLEETADLLVAIAQGNLQRTVPSPRYRDEVADVLQAISVLRANSIARVALEDERQRLVEQLRDQSNTDFLTGLPNRRGFFTLAERHIPNQQRHGYPVAVALFDIDHFKQVNDGYGHVVGDAVLVEVARLCGEQSRRGDVAARYGGEEFVVLMPHTDVASAIQHAERLRSAIEALRIPLDDGGELRITASFGVAACRPDDDSLDAAIAAADECLYRAKRQGRNRVVCAAA